MTARKPIHFALPALWLLGLTAADLSAQAPSRHHIGLRLRAFERRLNDVEAADLRRAAFTCMEQAVQNFFSLNLRGVAERVDAASNSLSNAPPTEAQRVAQSLDLIAAQRLIDPEEDLLRLQLQPAYVLRRDDDTDAVLPEGTVLHLQVAGLTHQCAVEDLPLDLELDAKSLAEGDHPLLWQLVSGDGELTRREQGISVVRQLAPRMDAADRLLDVMQAPQLEQRTARHLRSLLRQMRRQRHEETVLRGCDLLRQLETLCQLRPDERWLEPDRTGDHSVCLAVSADGRTTRSVPARVFVPQGLDPDLPVPLVIALHGAGGSENLFFDGYGDGAIVRECRRRGWILVAPRLGTGSGFDAGPVIASLRERLPVDPQRIACVGHSMGAMAAASSAAAARAVVAIGGGGSPQAAPETHWWLAAGSRDFGLPGVRGLSQSLQRRRQKAEMKVYPDVEHFTIVQVALPDAFDFLDRTFAVAALPR